MIGPDVTFWKKRSPVNLGHRRTADPVPEDIGAQERRKSAPFA